MKYLIATILALAHYPAVWGQTDHQFFQANSKSRLCYVDLSGGQSWVYTMVRSFREPDYYFINKTDTLFRQADGSYAGKNARIIRENDKLYLLSTSGIKRKFQLNAVADPDIVNNNLNNAYYLGQYLAISQELDKTYPLNHHSYHLGYTEWLKLPEKLKKNGVPAIQRMSRQAVEGNKRQPQHCQRERYEADNLHRAKHPPDGIRRPERQPGSTAY